MIENNFYINSGYKQINSIIEEFKNSATGSTIFPNNVAPINTYGDEFMQKSYKPLSSNSIIHVLVICYFESSQVHTSALFIDNVVNAIGASTFLFKVDYVSGKYINNSSVEKIFSFRAGVISAGNLYFNTYINNTSISLMSISEFIKI